MLKKPFSVGLGISRKDFFTIFFLLFNTLTWYYMTLLMIGRLLETSNVANTDVLSTWAIYFIAIIGSSVVGAKTASSTKRLYFVYLWMFLGVISSLLPALLLAQGFFWSLLLGASFGLGMPSCLSYFADLSTIENRGRASGIIFLITNLSAPMLLIFTSNLDITTSLIFTAIWRGTGLAIFYFLKPQESTSTEKRPSVSFKKILFDKSFLFFLIPWLMFNLINQFEGLVLPNVPDIDFPQLKATMNIMEPTIGSFAAFIGGILSDMIGRKRVVIYGFVALGLAYAAIGIAPMLQFSWFFYVVVDAIAWGLLLMIFILTLWGDLSQPSVREKYYVIGNTPFYLAALIQLFLAPYVKLIPAYAAFSLASFFLFLAVLPLMYAPETLPEKKMEIRRLKGYIEQAKKFTEKYTKKSSNKS